MSTAAPPSTTTAAAAAARSRVRDLRRAGPAGHRRAPACRRRNGPAQRFQARRRQRWPWPRCRRPRRRQRRHRWQQSRWQQSRCQQGRRNRWRQAGGIGGSRAGGGGSGRGRTGQRALRDDQLRLLGDDRRDPERLVQHRRHERDPAGAADQEQPGDRRTGRHAASASSDRVIATLGRSTGRIRPSSCSRPSGTSLPSAGTMTTVPLAPRQHLLRRAHVVPQLPARRRVGPQRARRSPAGTPTIGGVDVQAAEVVEAVGGDRLEAVRRPAQQRHVAGAGAQVVHHDAGAGGHVLRGGEVGGGGDGLGDQARSANPASRAASTSSGAPAGAPVRGVGQRHGVDGTGDPAPPRSPTRRRTAAIRSRTATSVSPSRTVVVVDAALRVGFEPFGGAAGQVRGVAAGVQAPVGAEQDRGGQQRRAVEQQRLDPPVGAAQHRDRRGRAEVDAEPEPRTRHGARQ